jgi:hypothetical protein
MPKNSLHFLSTDGFISSTLSLYDGFSVNAVLWPRSLLTLEISSDHILNLFIGEIFGKIWRVKVNLLKLYQYQSESIDAIYTLADCLITPPEMIYDESDFDASISIRNMIQKKKFEMNRSEMIYPDILD